MKPIDNNWIVENLINALDTWNSKLAEIWLLIGTSPETFKGGGVWNIVVGINGSLKAIGYGLLVLFTAIGIFGSVVNFKDFQRPEHALRHFIRFVAAKTAITYSMDILVTVFNICGGVVTTMTAYMGGVTGANAALPDEIKTAIVDVGFFQSIPLWLVTILGSLFITVLSFVMILTVYGRFFRLYMYTALAPIPLSSFAGEGTSAHGKAFIKSYIGVCMEGAVIVLALLIFSAIVSSNTPGLSAGSVVTQVWAYIGELIFNMLVLVGAVKGADRIAKEMLGT